MTGLTSLIINKPINCSKIDEELSKWNIWHEVNFTGNVGDGLVRIGKCSFAYHVLWKNNACMSKQNGCVKELQLPKPVLAFLSLDFYSDGGPTTVHFYLDDRFIHGPVTNGGSYNYQALASFQKIKVTMSGAIQPYRHVVITVTVLDVLEQGGGQ